MVDTVAGFAMIEQRLIRVYHCDRCHYEWLSRKPLKPPTMPPRVCPKCMSPNWNAGKRLPVPAPTSPGLYWYWPEPITREDKSRFRMNPVVVTVTIEGVGPDNDTCPIARGIHRSYGKEDAWEPSQDSNWLGPAIPPAFVPT